VLAPSSATSLRELEERTKPLEPRAKEVVAAVRAQERSDVKWSTIFSIATTIVVWASIASVIVSLASIAKALARSSSRAVFRKLPAKLQRRIEELIEKRKRSVEPGGGEGRRKSRGSGSGSTAPLRLKKVLSRRDVYDRVRAHFLSMGHNPREAVRLANGFANSFDWSRPVTSRIAYSELWYRYGRLTGGTKGSFLTKAYFNDSRVAIDQLNLGPYGNPATGRQIVRIIGPTEVIEGAVAGGRPAGTTQAMVLDWDNVEFGRMVPIDRR